MIELELYRPPSGPMIPGAGDDSGVGVGTGVGVDSGAGEGESPPSSTFWT